MEKLENCLCCGGNRFGLYERAKDNYASELFDIVQCEDCGFVFTNPRPDTNEIGQYYVSPDYISHNSHSRGLMPSIYRLARQYMMRKKLALIQSIVGKEEGFSLLDFGCGTGDFLGFVQQHGIVAEGVEPDAHAREVAKAVNKVETYSIEASRELGAEKYEVITLWHVLEHVHLLHEQIDLFRRWLKPGGKLIIAVPNIESHDAREYGKYWDALDVPRHLYHFSPQNLRSILDEHQFSFKAQHPLFLDAYYVSMRSEWHKGTGKMAAYFKGILSGWKSNREAARTGNYSSLIYVFEKA